MRIGRTWYARKTGGAYGAATRRPKAVNRAICLPLVAHWTSHAATGEKKRPNQTAVSDTIPSAKAPAN